jgi:LuxR family transcriptional regulator, maltose regulon positive regulatory protein
MNRLRRSPVGNRPPSKLVPPPANRIVHRPRVIAALDRAVKAGICWIAAPAGYGKTSAVLDYLRRKRMPVIWYRIDEGDQDIASFFHFLGTSLLPRKGTAPLPVFGPEYADQPADFARRFFRAWFARLTRRRMLVIDDLHYADTPGFRKILAILLRELPDDQCCVCLSRNLVPTELKDLGFRGRLKLIDESVLRYSEREARALLGARLPRRAASFDVSAARGWAAGLIMMADRAGAEKTPAARRQSGPRDGQEVFAALARQMFEELSGAEQESLLTMSLLPEVTADLAEQLTGTPAVRGVLGRLHQRQLLVTRGESAHASYQMHDLLRDFLKSRLEQQLAPAELSRLRERAATLLDSNGRVDAAIELALEAQSWPLARDLLLQHAESLVVQGRRVTFTDWCAALPAAALDSWLCYWLGVANMADDATAEHWFEKAWDMFAARGDVAGLWLTAARAVLAKTDSWRTHEGLADWTRRMLDLMGRGRPVLADDDQLLALAGMLRAVDFAQDYQIDNAGVRALTRDLLERLDSRGAQSANLRVTASQTLIDHAGSTGNAGLFEQAVDAVAADLRSPSLSSWILGIWLVTFGAVTSRYFTYGRRGFPYGTPEEALRAAWTIGEGESLRGVEFGALYHLQLLMKMRNDWSEFGALIARIARIADSRYTTQVAVAADCHAALHTVQGNFAEAYRACERFMAAIEAANEPPIERWPHFITRFQVLLADRRPHEAAVFLEGLLPLFDGAMLQRTRLCVQVAHTFAAKWSASPQFHHELRSCLQALAAANWSAVLINQPALLAELAADGLEREIERDYCAALIERRRLRAPAARPAHWPWELRIYLLGEFRLVREGEPLSMPGKAGGTKAPTRTLDVLRALALAKNHTCSLHELYEWLWPDADGDAAKAACEQALHRLRKLLAMPDVLVQREGKLRLDAERVWVDLEAFERTLAQALNPRLESREAETAMQKAFDEFAGPLLETERAAAWTLPAAERVRSKFLDLAERLARHQETRGDHAAARAVYLRAIDKYPTSARCYEGLIRNRLTMRDEAGALDAYQRYRRMLETQGNANPTPAIRALVGKLLQ